MGHLPILQLIVKRREKAQNPNKFTQSFWKFNYSKTNNEYSSKVSGNLLINSKKDWKKLKKQGIGEANIKSLPAGYTSVTFFVWFIIFNMEALIWEGWVSPKYIAYNGNLSGYFQQLTMLITGAFLTISFLIPWWLSQWLFTNRATPTLKIPTSFFTIIKATELRILPQTVYSNTYKW